MICFSLVRNFATGRNFRNIFQTTINLIDAARLDHLERFGEELQEIFGLLKCRGDKEAILAYANEHKEYFQHMDKETGLMVGEMLQSESIVKKMKKSTEKGEERDMCKALDDLYNDGVELGKELERQKGIEKAIKMCKEFGASKEEAASKIIGMYERSKEEAFDDVEQYWDL